MSKLQKRVLENLTLNTKMKVYQACVLSTLLYGSETWTTHAKHQKKLNVFHMRCLRKILGITWEDKVTNSEVLSKAKLSSIFAMPVNAACSGMAMSIEWRRVVSQRTSCMDSWNVAPVQRPPSSIYVTGLGKRDLQSANIDINSWEDLASNAQPGVFALKSGITELRKTVARNGHPSERRERH
ncbi:putative cytohesin-3-like [Apostichopus japonicus]|uniref:Putative cytohesin-3-like n=1 Tax=Stichopus japonicus TaxID=307972 RepID=A0A2G8KSJ5_STIJA|nr:putative cytohesin-3-like [Apostichopus japonicus]